MPIFFSTRHYAYNLEPYNDALYYALGAKNFATGRGWGLFAGDQLLLDIPTPPLYILFLAPFSFLPTPIFFVIANLCLQIGSVIILYLLLKHFTAKKHWEVVPLGLILYLSHGYVFWLVNVAMIENLGLFLILLTLYALLVLPGGWKQNLFLCLLAFAFVFTKYTYLPIAAAIFLIVMIKFWRQKHFWLVIGIIIFALLSVAILSFSLPILFAIVKELGQLTSPEETFFNFSFLPKNIFLISKSLLGLRAPFLWLGCALTSIIVLAIFLLSLYLAYQQKRHRLNNLYLLLLFLVQFPIQLIFSVYDNRYLVLIIPIMIVTIFYNWLPLVNFFKNHIRFNIIALVILILWHLVSQTRMYGKLLAENLLHTADPWQYYSTLVIDDFMSSQPDAHMITALSLPYVDYFSNLNTFPYLSLETSPSAYLSLVASSSAQPVYVSNAYITYTDSAIAHYERYKLLYNFEEIPLTNDCDGVCKIYRLSLKDHNDE